MAAITSIRVATSRQTTSESIVGPAAGTHSLHSKRLECSTNRASKEFPLAGRHQARRSAGCHAEPGTIG